MVHSSGTITIFHFNDCYNIEPQKHEPVGGAARFCTAVKRLSHLNPLVLFSGDILAPSLMSTFTQGEQMIPVLNALNVHCAVYGNHDFDFGIDNLLHCARETSFPWLMSNVIDNETKQPLADGKIYHIVEWEGKKLGIIGLVEIEWLATLATIDPSEVTYSDFVTEGRKLARLLKDKGVDYVIALTHMRTPNDTRLAENVDEIDLILGGHDHVYEVKQVNGKYIIKSGTDFRNFSVVTLSFNHNKVDVTVENITVTSDIPEDDDLKAKLEKYSGLVDSRMDVVLGTFSVDLDGTFASIRTRETNLGNFICDVMLASTHSDLAILNSGTLRSDRIHRKGQFTMRDLHTILPIMDPLVVLNVPGRDIVTILENGVSQYPKLEGRFPQVAGVAFGFNPNKPPGERVDPRYIKIGDEYLDVDQVYRLATKEYLHMGKDGYDVLKNAEVVLDVDSSPELCIAIQNHFQSIRVFSGCSKTKTKHRQSLVCLSRRHSVVKMIEGNISSSSVRSMRRGASLDAAAKRNLFQRQTSVDDIEKETCKLEPKIEGRIFILTDEIRQQLEKERLLYETLSLKPDPIEEVEENSSFDQT
uniref:5'-Nucleotidase C-terminal domain-containing protein n=1 Tax=Strigamia maritima TaxID=126957 RepID=T1ISA7_STRMM